MTIVQAQMVRRVKAYLKTMKVITNEEELHKMSLECEPPIGGLHPLHSLNSTAVTAPTMVRKVATDYPPILLR